MLPASPDVKGYKRHCRDGVVGKRSTNVRSAGIHAFSFADLPGRISNARSGTVARFLPLLAGIGGLSSMAKRQPMCVSFGRRSLAFSIWDRGQPVTRLARWSNRNPIGQHIGRVRVRNAT